MVRMQTFFIALADRTRRRILNLLRQQEICVCFLTEVLDISQPKISRHLAYLRNAEIVSARREGKWIYYRIVEPEDFHAAQILRDTLDWLESDERMRNDYEKLKTICDSAEIPIKLAPIPKPAIFQKANTSYEKREQMETYLL